MKLSVIGAGYLGAVHATMASLGFQTVGLDVDPERIDALGAGKAPFFEPGFDELLGEVTESGQLSWTLDYAELDDVDVHFLCVGTPQNPESHAADLSYVWAAVEALLPHLKPRALVVGKSTVPVGTAAAIAERIRACWISQAEAIPQVVWNPEFLREGFAVQDTLHPDRIVVGVPQGDDGVWSERVMREVYAAQLDEGSRS